MSNYRRTSKPKTEHIKKGFTVFQKTVATIGSILGLINRKYHDYERLG